MRRFRDSALAGVLLVLLAAPLPAQSLFGTRGLGVPAPPIDARSAALGGIGLGLIGFSTSMVNPAEVAGVTRRGVSAAFQPVSTTLAAGGTEEGTGGSRFPVLRIIYPVNERLVASIGYGSYLDQSWAVVRDHTLDLDGRSVQVRDVQSSIGGLAQLRIGAAYTLTPGLAVGLAGGLLTGNVERTVARSVGDTAFDLRPFQQQLRWQYQAPIVAAGFRWDAGGALRLSGSALIGGDVEARGAGGGAEDRAFGSPLEFSGAASARVGPLLMATAGAAWGRVPDAGAGVETQDVLRVGGGVEYQGLRSTVRTYPVRAGARWSRLPYHLPGESTPSETAFGLGLGFLLGDQMDPAAVADISVERASRTGLAGTAISGGVEERLWRFTFSLSLFGR